MDDGVKALEGAFEHVSGSVVPSHHLAVRKVLGQHGFLPQQTNHVVPSGEQEGAELRANQAVEPLTSTRRRGRSAISSMRLRSPRTRSLRKRNMERRRGMTVIGAVQPLKKWKGRRHCTVSTTSIGLHWRQTGARDPSGQRSLDHLVGEGLSIFDVKVFGDPHGSQA